MELSLSFGQDCISHLVLVALCSQEQYLRPAGACEDLPHAKIDQPVVDGCRGAPKALAFGTSRVRKYL